MEVAMKKTVRILVVVFVLFVILTLLYGCSGGKDTGKSTSEATGSETVDEGTASSQGTEATEKWTVPKQETGLNNDKSLDVLERFLGSETKHIIGRYSILYYSGERTQPLGFELWIKGDKIRIDEFNDDQKFRTLYSIDGVAKNYMYGTGGIEDSAIPLGYYINFFTQDLSAAESLGEDQYGKALQFKFTVDSYYENEEGKNGYYVTDIIYLADSTKVRTQIIYGRDSNGSRPEDLNELTQTLDMVEIGINIQDSIFQPPF
jgi:hypothetical protein